MGQVLDGYGILQATTDLEFSRSNGEASKLVRGGGIRLSGRKIADPLYKIGPGDFDGQGLALLERGKNTKGIIKLIRGP
jgi:tyrosyl-tRNA synthetase